MPCEVFCWNCGKQIKPIFGEQYTGREQAKYAKAMLYTEVRNKP